MRSLRFALDPKWHIQKCRGWKLLSIWDNHKCENLIYRSIHRGKHKHERVGVNVRVLWNLILTSISYLFTHVV